MRRTHPGWMAGCLIALLASSACDDSPRAEVPDELRGEVELRLEDAAAAGFSGSALVVIEGVTVLERGYGLADRENEVPNGPGVAYDFGSVLKDLTAAAIFKLADEGEFAVADSLASILGEAPPDKAGITILQIVQHRAGFHPYHDTEGDFEPMTRLEARQRIFAQELLFEPGSADEYSNSGYTLLADIVQTVSGREFTDYVRDELLAPAGMDESGFFGDPVWQRVDTAIGYDDGVFGDNDPSSWPYTWALVGNGGLVATASDLDRWLVAVRNGDVLTDAAFQAYEADYLQPHAGSFEGKTVYVAAGAGDFGLGGVAVDSSVDTRLVLATNAYTQFDVEALAEELAVLLLSEREDTLSRTD